MIRNSIKTLERVYKHYYFIIRGEVIPMCNFPARRRYASALRLYYA